MDLRRAIAAPLQEAAGILVHHQRKSTSLERGVTRRVAGKEQYSPLPDDARARGCAGRGGRATIHPRVHRTDWRSSGAVIRRPPGSSTGLAATRERAEMPGIACSTTPRTDPEPGWIRQAMEGTGALGCPSSRDATGIPLPPDRLPLRRQGRQAGGSFARIADPPPPRRERHHAAGQRDQPEQDRLVPSSRTRTARRPGPPAPAAGTAASRTSAVAAARPGTGCRNTSRSAPRTDQDP